MTKKNKTIALTGMNLVALAGAILSPFFSGEAFAANDSVGDCQANQLATLNAASLRSMEQSWLQVPKSCKDHAFNAHPTPVRESQSADALAVYAAV